MDAVKAILLLKDDWQCLLHKSSSDSVLKVMMPYIRSQQRILQLVLVARSYYKIALSSLVAVPQMHANLGRRTPIHDVFFYSKEKFLVEKNFKFGIKELSQKVPRNMSSELKIIKQIKELCSLCKGQQTLEKVPSSTEWLNYIQERKD